MKVCILYQFKNGPYGGANQFLKALKEYFEAQGCYEEELGKADVILYNSSNATKEILTAKVDNQDKLFVQRMDGPSSLYTQKKDQRDVIAAKMNQFVADATVFQTNYVREANFALGLCRNKFETTIPNAPNPAIFYKKVMQEKRQGKIRLIASSWSPNIHKGFETYQYLDEHLDFEKYEMYFVGNSPIEFHNIKKVEPLQSEKLAEMLRSCDIYITASQKDPCSNSLIEAMFCGLPVVALRDGGHPELVGEAGELFDRCEEIPDLLDKICQNYDFYREKMCLEDIEHIGKRYYDFLSTAYENQKSGKYKAKYFGARGKVVIRFSLMKMRVMDKMKRVFHR